MIGVVGVIVVAVVVVVVAVVGVEGVDVVEELWVVVVVRAVGGGFICLECCLLFVGFCFCMKLPAGDFRLHFSCGCQNKQWSRCFYSSFTRPIYRKLEHGCRALEDLEM